MKNGKHFKEWIKSKGLKVGYVADAISVNNSTMTRIFITGKCSRQTAQLIKQFTNGEIDFTKEV